MATCSNDILERLPHRQPFLFLTDRITLAGDDSGQAVWRVTGDEPFLAGHFPGSPIVPGVLIGEALAQLSGLIAAERLGLTSLAVNSTRRRGAIAPGKLAHIDLRFNRAVTPPADLDLSSRLQRVFGVLWQFRTEERRGGEEWASTGVAEVGSTLP